jgi:hypothetical protein
MNIFESRVEEAIKDAIRDENFTVPIRCYWLDDESETYEEVVTPCIEILASPGIPVTHRTGPHRNIAVSVRILTHTAADKDAKRQTLRSLYKTVVEVIDTTDWADFIPTTMTMDLVYQDSQSGIDGVLNVVELNLIAKVCGDPGDSESSSSSSSS